MNLQKNTGHGNNSETMKAEENIGFIISTNKADLN